MRYRCLFLFAAALSACGDSFSSATVAPDTTLDGASPAPDAASPVVDATVALDVPVTPVADSAAPPGVTVIGSPPASTGVGASNGFLAVDPTGVFFTYKSGTSAGGVAFVPTASTAVRCVFCGSGEPREIAANGGFVYWTNVVANTVTRAPVTGSPVSVLATGSTGSPIAVDAANVYWFNPNQQMVAKANLDGTSPMSAATGQAAVASIQAQAGKVYFATPAAILASDSTGTVVLVGNLTEPRSLALDATHVYWTEPKVKRVSRFATNSAAAAETVADAAAFEIAVDATHVYATDNANGTVWQAPKTGGAPEIVASGLSYPFDIAVDATNVYFTSEVGAQVFSVAK
jgi:hypothetical protein